MSFNIAIDGPAGAGKSTIAKKIAKLVKQLYTMIWGSHFAKQRTRKVLITLSDILM